MKAVAFIISLIILLLTLMPCADVHLNESASEKMSGISATGEHNPVSHIDLCSPFCFCHCCQVISIPTDLFSLNFHIFQAEIKRFDFRKQTVQTYLSLWKPPKIDLSESVA